jgi:glucosyl-3-phosphoglycerate synthase
VPARDEAETIGGIVSVLVDARARGLVDQVAVIDGGSTDATAMIAAAGGAEVYQRDELMQSFGRARGKGDAIWRAQAVLDADVLCFFDADLYNFSEEYLHALAAPLLGDNSVQLVKGTFERPLRVGDVILEAGGGRVTELMARPLLKVFYPELATLGQPLSGQFAVRAPLLASLPLPTGYGIDIALLIGVWRAAPGAIVEADLGRLETRHQSLVALGQMASAVLETVLWELVRESRLDPAVVPPPVQGGRPSFRSVHVGVR